MKGIPGPGSAHPVPLDWILELAPDRVYKGQGLGMAVKVKVTLPDPAWGQPGEPGMQLLMLGAVKRITLSCSASSTWCPSGTSQLHSILTVTGADRLEQDLVSVGLSRGPHSAEALEMLFRFPAIGIPSLNSIRAFDPEGNDTVNVLRAE